MELGRGIIRELAAAGYDIAFSYRTREDEAKEAAEEIRNMGSFAGYAKADMAQAGEGEKFFDQAVRELGGLDLLVNNAGVTVFQSILDLEMEGNPENAESGSFELPCTFQQGGQIYEGS